MISTTQTIMETKTQPLRNVLVNNPALSWNALAII